MHATDRVLRTEIVTQLQGDELSVAPSADGRSLLFELHERKVDGSCCAPPRIARLLVDDPTRYAFLTPTDEVARTPAWRDDETFVYATGTVHRGVLARRDLAPPFEGKIVAVFTSAVTAPAVSSDGTLAFAAKVRGTVLKPGKRRWETPTMVYEWHVFVESIEGSLLDLGEGSAPSLAPDGKSVAYAGFVDGHSHILVRDFASQEDRQITFGSFEDDEPAWSPDRTKIVFVRRIPGHDDSTRLMLVSAEGGPAVTLVDGSARVQRPAFAPGGWIYYAADAHGTFDLFRIEPR